MPAASEQTQDPHLWPASRRGKVVRDLIQGSDTVAGIAHRYGLPVPTILQWRDQGPRLDEGGRDTLLMRGAQPLQSRMDGPA
jgi:transposase-like protein